jgi:outer membrane protein assembly factor BamB
MSLSTTKKRYCKWFWDESLGGDYDNWGTSTYLMEVGHNLYAIRQIEIYQNGNVLFYDSSHVADDCGRLCDKPLNEEDIQYYAIDEAEFEEIWNTKIPMNR